MAVNRPIPGMARHNSMECLYFSDWIICSNILSIALILIANEFIFLDEHFKNRSKRFWSGAKLLQFCQRSLQPILVEKVLTVNSKELQIAFDLIMYLHTPSNKLSPFTNDTTIK